MAFVLEEGKRYRRRDGKETGKMVWVAVLSNGCFLDPYSAIHYTFDGRCGNKDLDIIADSIGEASTPCASNLYSTLTTDAVGALRRILTDPDTPASVCATTALHVLARANHRDNEEPT
jgi:hypothetical protein